MVPVVDSQRLVIIVQIAYEVIEHLVLVQVVIVDTDVIQVDRTALATDHDIPRNLLLEIILRRILRRPGHDAVYIDIDQTVLRTFLHHEGDTYPLLLLEPGVDRGLLGREHRFLGRYLKADSPV